jgi:hypothetical protein
VKNLHDIVYYYLNIPIYIFIKCCILFVFNDKVYESDVDPIFQIIYVLLFLSNNRDVLLFSSNNHFVM